MSVIMTENLIYGILPAEQPLVSLREILSQVYQNLLPRERRKQSPKCKSLPRTNVLRRRFLFTGNSGEERDQLRMTFNRFALQIDSTLRQMQGEFHLTTPNKNLLVNTEETEEEYIENLEYLVYDWETILHEEMNNELNKRVVDASPLAELEFWHERSIRITSILEQMTKGETPRLPTRLARSVF